MTWLVALRTRFGAFAAIGSLLTALASVGCGERSELLGVLLAAGADGGSDASGKRPHFGAATLVDELNVDDIDDEAPTLTADLLEIYFMSGRDGTRHLWTSTRATPQLSWQPPRRVSELDTSSYEITPSVSWDGLRLWFCVGSTPTSVWLSTRAARSDLWGAPTLVTDLLAPTGIEQLNSPSLNEAETMLAVALRGTGTASWDLYGATRSGTGDAWGALVPLAGVNGDSKEYDPALGEQGTELFFSSSKSGMGDLFWSARPAVADAFQVPVALTELNTAAFNEFDPFFASDRSVVFFASDRRGFADIYQALAEP